MQCYDRSAHVRYPHHDEFVAAGTVHGHALGFCSRCHEITDLACCIRHAESGNERCAGALRRAGYTVEPVKYVLCIPGFAPETYTSRQDAEREQAAAAREGHRGGKITETPPRVRR